MKKKSCTEVRNKIAVDIFIGDQETIICKQTGTEYETTKEDCGLKAASAIATIQRAVNSTVEEHSFNKRKTQ